MTERYISTGTPLTPRQSEILAILIEEASEVIKRATKAMRFGLDECQPGQDLTNAQRLAREIGDFSYMVGLAHTTSIISELEMQIGFENKERQIAKFMQHQE